MKYLILLLSLSLLLFSCDKNMECLVPTQESEIETVECYYLTVTRVDLNYPVTGSNNTVFRVSCDINLDSFKIQIGCNRGHIACDYHINQ